MEPHWRTSHLLPIRPVWLDFNPVLPQMISSSFGERADILVRVSNARCYNEPQNCVLRALKVYLAYKMSIEDIPSQQVTFLMDIQACKFLLSWGSTENLGS